MLWKFTRINEPNIKHFRLENLINKKSVGDWVEFNIFYGDPNSKEDGRGLRHDPSHDVGFILEKIAKENKDKTFIAIFDQGEHFLNENKITNFHYFNRKFHHALFHFDKPLPKIKEQKNKWFWCPMGRADIHRTIFFDRLKDENLFDHGHISYLCSDDNPERKIDNSLYRKSGGRHLGVDIPFNNFEEHIGPTGSLKINWESMNECLFGISVETGASNSTAWYTEKTYQVMVMGLVPIVVAGMGAIGQLENMGYRIPDYINWRLYDHWPADQWGSARDKTKHIIKDLSKFIQGHQLKDISKDWYPNALFNQEHFIKRIKKLYEQEENTICEWILTITHNLSNPKYQYLWNTKNHKI